VGESGVAVTLARGTRTINGGQLLVGGSPTTILRLSGRFAGSHSSTHLGQRMLASGVGHPEVDDVPRPLLSDITVVVPVRDRPDLLARCLSSLASLSVIVVDDASKDSTTIAALTAQYGGTLITLARNVGPAGARNVGLRRVVTPYVAFVDSDVIVTPAALLDIARHFADPQVTLAAPRVCGQAGAPARWFQRHDAARSSLDLGVHAAEVRAGSPIGYVPSACLVARTADLGSGFDETLRVGEDVDLVWRIREAGGRVRYDADTLAHHQVRSTLRAWLGRKVAYGASAAPLAEKYGSQVAPAVLSPLPGIAAAFLLTRTRWAVPATAIAIAASHRRALHALGRHPATRRTAADLAVRSVGWGLRQESSLLLRHWWPASLAVTVLTWRSPITRNVLTSALVVDTVVACADERSRRAAGDSPLDAATLLVGRRFDDAFYGIGVWIGVIAARSIRALVPRIVTSYRAVRAPR